jgi:DNA mismatch repair protein MutS2
MTVYLENFHKEGEILEVKPGADQVLVQVGPLKMKVGKKELSILTHYGKAPDKKAAPKKTKGSDRHAMNTRLDLRGRTAEEAAYMVEKFLSDAVVANASKLTIVHGKGTGVLQRVVQDYLKKSKMIRTFRFGNPSEGGTGATIVEL